MLGLQIATDRRRAEAWWPQAALYAADFANDRYMREGVAITRDTALTLARGSSKLAQNSAGQWLSFPANTLARTDLGASLEPASTNFIHNSTMVGAAAGTPGTIPAGWTMPTTTNGLTRQVVGAGTINGLPYVDIRISGTTTAENFVNLDLVGSNYVPATNGQTWTLPCFVALAAGSFDGLLPGLACRLRVAVRSSGGTYLGELSSSPSISPTRTLARFHQTATIANASAGVIAPYIQMWYPTGAPIDATLRLAAPQLERAAQPSSPIQTSGTASSRAEDSLTINQIGATSTEATNAAGAQILANGAAWTPNVPTLTHKIVCT